MTGGVAQDNPITRGEAALQRGDAAAALAAFGQILAHSPDDVRALIGCGIACGQSGDLDGSARHLQRAAALAPDQPAIHANLSKLALERGDWASAEDSARRAIALAPADPIGHDNLCVALKRQGRWDEMAAALETGLAQCPKPGNLFHTLGELHQRCGEMTAAVDAFNRAPASAANISALIGSFNYADLRPPQEVFAIHQQFAGRLEAAYRLALPPPRPPRSEGRLRIGYVSSDLRDHSVAFFVESVLAAHDRDRFDLYCYATSARGDSVTRRLQALVGNWRPCARLSDRAIADLIRRDEIDILIDLGGHTVGNRLAVFAMRAAPVQATWIGYPNTTGLAAMDFRLTDGISDPPGADKFHTERLIRLPSTFLCYRPPDEAPPPNLPAANRPVTFGSFNAVPKYSDACLAAWAGILERLPEARLMLKASDLTIPRARRRVMAAFESRGIAPQRVDLLPQIASRRDHLAAYDGVDIALDPFPYNGTTTTCEALWMGVPVVTLRGQAHAGRVGASLLHQVGLDQVATGSPQAYINMAVELASPSRAQQRHDWRRTLRSMMRNAVLCQPDLFVPSLESAFINMAAIRRKEMKA